MFTTLEKVMMAITGAECLLIIGGYNKFKKEVRNRCLKDYGMTAEEFMDAVIAAKSVEEYPKKLGR